MCPFDSQQADAVSWIHRVGEGDRDALKLLYDSYCQPLMRLAYRICGDAMEAEEVVQDLFVRVWKRARQYDAERSSPLGWLFMMTRSLAIDRCRRRRTRENKQNMEPNELSANLFAEEMPTVDTEAFADEMIDNWLQTLPAEQRRYLEMTVLEGYTQAEVSDVLGQPLGTVKSSIRRGLQRLRSLVLKEQRS